MTDDRETEIARIEAIMAALHWTGSARCIQVQEFLQLRDLAARLDRAMGKPEPKAGAFELPSLVPVQVSYKNHRGKVALRTILPLTVWYGNSLWHEDGPQWFVRAFDVDKEGQRDFALKDFGATPLPEADDAR